MYKTIIFLFLLIFSCTLAPKPEQTLASFLDSLANFKENPHRTYSYFNFFGQDFAFSLMQNQLAYYQKDKISFLLLKNMSYEIKEIQEKENYSLISVDFNLLDFNKATNYLKDLDLSLETLNEDFKNKLKKTDFIKRTYTFKVNKGRRYNKIYIAGQDKKTVAKSLNSFFEFLIFN